MANYNARDFLRDSIAGDVANGINQPKVSANSDLSNKKNTSIPPILVVPPNTSKEEFVGKVEKAYNISEYLVFKNLTTDKTAGEVEHSIRIMDQGIYFLLTKNLYAASDMFSLCVILSSNYFYKYLLALIRFQLADYKNSLFLLESAITQIKEKQVIDLELLDLSKDFNFSENFYELYILSLLYNNKIKEAELITNFAVDKKILQTVEKNIDLIAHFKAINSTKILDKLLKTTMENIGKNKNLKEQREQLVKLVSAESYF